jgi:hypothetical protein
MKTGDDGTYPEYFLRELRKTSITSRLSRFLRLRRPPLGFRNGPSLRYVQISRMNFLFRLR